MSYHIHKDEIQLAWLDNRDRVKNELKAITRRVENEVLRVLDDKFTEGINNGEVLEVRPGAEEMRKLYLEAANSQLGVEDESEGKLELTETTEGESDGD